MAISVRRVDDKELLQAECKPDCGSVVLWARLVEACEAVEKGCKEIQRYKGYKVYKVRS